MRVGSIFFVAVIAKFGDFNYYGDYEIVKKSFFTRELNTVVE